MTPTTLPTNIPPSLEALLGNISKNQCHTWLDVENHLNSWLHHLKIIYPHVVYYVSPIYIPSHVLVSYAIILFDTKRIHSTRLSFIAQNNQVVLDVSDFLVTLACLESKPQTHISNDVLQKATNLVLSGQLISANFEIDYRTIEDCNQFLANADQNRDKGFKKAFQAVNETVKSQLHQTRSASTSVSLNNETTTATTIIPLQPQTEPILALPPSVEELKAEQVRLSVSYGVGALSNNN